MVDQENGPLQEVAATTGTQWGISMTAGDTYSVAGRKMSWGPGEDHSIGRLRARRSLTSLAGVDRHVARDLAPPSS